MVTPRSRQCVKSDCPSRPDVLLGEEHLLAGPSMARQRLSRRCNVRSWPSAKRPGCSAATPRTTSWPPGPGWPRPARDLRPDLGERIGPRPPVSDPLFASLGSCPPRRYFRAVFASMPALAAAISWFCLCFRQPLQPPDLCVCDHLQSAPWRNPRWSLIVVVEPGILIVVGREF